MPATLRVRAIQARGTLYAARTTLRACATLFRTHDPAGVRDYVPRPRPCGRGRLRTMVRCIVRQRPRQTCAMRRSSSRARIRATQCESERSTAGAMDGGSSDRAAAGRDPGRRCRSDRGRRHHGRYRRARPFAERRPFAFDPARTTLRAGATRRGSLGRAHGTA